MASNLHKIEQDYEREPTGSSLIIWIVFASFVAFIIWSFSFELEQFVRAQGQVISSSRVQQIQTVDGGVVSEINVREGDTVKPGQILAKIDKTRFEAQTNEVLARVNALKAKVSRLRAEVTNTPLTFPTELNDLPEITGLEVTIYNRRLNRLQDDLDATRHLLTLAIREKTMVEQLNKTGDVNKTELLNAQRAVVDAQAKLDAVRNDYFEQSSQELAQTEDELAQSLEVLNQRSEVLRSSTLRALVPGIVKNISVTTLGAVTKPGETLMEIIPSQDMLLIEAQIPPVDIGELREGLPATLRFDPYDSSIYGTVAGDVSYISGDTIAEMDGRGNEKRYYITHIRLPEGEVVTSIGKPIEIMPGMTTTVDIKTGKRTVINYILKPIIKTLDRSFGEK